jgi:twinkle protein
MMTPEEFSSKYLYPFITKGPEIIAELCPFCHGGDRHDKKTFALNVEKKTYNCKRGSCGAAGTFGQLLEHFGEHKYETRQQVKHYKAPQTQIRPAPKPVEEYLIKRGFSKATWEKYGVGDDGNGNIAMPYYENGKIVMMKFREARAGGKKGWREEDGKPVFWGMQFCNPADPLTIVEGEMDLLALVEAGIQNVISMPSGSQDLTCISLCWDWLQKFKRVVIWVDSDEPGQELQRNLIQKLGAWRCFVVNSEWKDANEVLLHEGKDAVFHIWDHAVEVPQAGLIRLADVKSFDYSTSIRVRSGLRGVDQVLGGFMMGQFTVWSGRRASGKSTLLGQVLLDAISQGFAVCAYSGELPSPIFRYWIDIQAAGPENIELVYDQIKDSTVARVRPETVSAIREWYRERFFLYDNFGITTEASMFEVFEYAARRYDCKVFMIDNLMTTMLESGSESDYWRRQSLFVNRVAEFAQRLDVHVHLVAHPRKANGRELENDDVGGSGDITNRADNVMILNRLDEPRRIEKGCDSILTVKKNRMNGKQNIDIALLFDGKSRRFYMQSDPIPKAYGWRGDTCPKP